MSKKSFHTGKISNQDLVWQAEEKAKEEKRKLEQLKKEIEEERRRDELRELQKKAGLVPNVDERMSWMVYGPSKAEKKEKEEKSPTPLIAKESSSSDGKRWIKKYEERDADVAAKIREDPMLQIMKARKVARDEVLKNPILMREIDDDIRRSADRSRRLSPIRSRHASSRRSSSWHRYGSRERYRRRSPERFSRRSPERSRRSSKLSTEERDRRLAEMRSDAQEHSQNRQRFVETRTYKDRDASKHTKGSFNFIHTMVQEAYSGKGTVEDRINRNRHFRQKGDISEQHFI